MANGASKEKEDPLLTKIKICFSVIQWILFFIGLYDVLNFIDEIFFK